ncbi:MAG TPA: hypothetical protein VFA66_00085 [Gaiellaceae bacterium]|nr:hypothetical protein [Gaiellaceae bacterium]
MLERASFSVSANVVKRAIGLLDDVLDAIDKPARWCNGRGRGRDPLPAALLVANRRRIDAPLGEASLDRWCVEVADQRRRDSVTVAQLAAAEPLLPLPPVAYPAELQVERVVSASALVAFEGNRYSVPPSLAGQGVSVLARLGEPNLRIVSAAGVMAATHRRLPTGAGQVTRTELHRAALEQAVLAAFTTKPPCARKPNRPPGTDALALAVALDGALAEPKLPSLDEYAVLAAARWGSRASTSSCAPTSPTCA